jgi:hypothetical protein
MAGERSSFKLFRLHIAAYSLLSTVALSSSVAAPSEDAPDVYTSITEEEWGMQQKNIGPFS